MLDGTHGSPERTDNGVPVLSAQNVANGVLDYWTDRFTSEQEYVAFNKRVSLKQNDVLLTIVGTIGRAAVIDRVEPAVFQRSVAILRPNAKALDARYLYHITQSPEFVEQARKFTKQSTQAGIYLGNLKKIEIPVPPLEEQKRIAAILGKADQLRLKRGQAITLLDSLTQSIFLEMFGETASLDWPSATIGEVALDMRTGPFGSQLLHSEFVDQGVAVLGIDNAVSNRFEWGKARFITEKKYRELSRYTVRPNDVLITIMGTCGRCAVVPDDIPIAINTKHLCCITLDEKKVLPQYLHACFLNNRSVLRQLGVQAKGAVMPGLNMGIIKSLVIPLPPISLQERFRGTLKTVMKQIRFSEFATVYADNLFTSLQQRAFTGQL
ncbi:restriction endonuclease subunit S [Rhizobium laguerreae]|nr:restriction endonuclease subunit S [Rhizobium laguerreae]